MIGMRFKLESKAFKKFLKDCCEVPSKYKQINTTPPAPQNGKVHYQG